MLHCSRCPVMALSWLSLPCALKAAIGKGKRTLGVPRQSAARRGAAARPVGLIARPRADGRPQWRPWPIASARPRRRSGQRGSVGYRNLGGAAKPAFPPAVRRAREGENPYT